MVESPRDTVDIDDYDDIAAYIADAMAEGYTIEADDLEGQDCQYCGETIPFVEWPDAVVLWDIPIMEPGDERPPDAYARYYFCSESCKKSAMRDADWTADHDRIDPEQVGQPIAEDVERGQTYD